MKKIALLLTALLPLLFFACKKEAGPTGPAGANGTNGKDGNANVYYSNWHYLTTTWGDTNIDNTSLKYNRDSAAVITQGILDSGAVLVYFNYGAGVFPLPYTSYAGGAVNTMNFILGLKQIIYTRFTHDNSASAGVGGLQWRYIVIPGGKLTGKKETIPGSYKEVCQMYNISM
jgi:hypothetical protein